MARKRFFDMTPVRSTLCGALVGLALVGVVLHRDGRTAEAAHASQQATPASTHPVERLEPVVLSRRVDLRHVQTSAQAQHLAQWIVDSADNGDAPFVIVDKRGAQVLVFTPDGELIDSAPALLGLALGDHSVPGIGDRPMSQIQPEERTTPAGRFVSEPGRNHLGEAVLWVDYDAAVSMHRLRRSIPAERRAERLASPTPDDNRITYGCINLPVDFFEQVLWPTLGHRHGIVYVMPDQLQMQEVFPVFADAQGLHAVTGPVPRPGS